MYIEDLRSKKIAVLGFGAEGLAVARYLFSNGISFTIFDQKDPSLFENQYRDFLKQSGVSIVSGADYLARLSEFEVAFRSPGLWRLHPALLAAEEKGTIITSQTMWFFEHCPCPIIGVTGTKGKGTTSALITAMLTLAIEDQAVASGSMLQNADRVYLTGNIGLQSPLELLPTLTDRSIVVFELSSFQLQDLTVSPHIAVVLMTTVEHQDVHASEQEYHRAKQSIAQYQAPSDMVIINRDYQASRRIGEVGQGSKLYFSTSTMSEVSGYVSDHALCINLNERPFQIPLDRIQLRGKHNWQNILAASLAAASIGALPEPVIAEACAFSGLEHRLEYVDTRDGIIFYNDSFSTTPETTIAAINSFAEPLILILGGSEKQSDFTELGNCIAAASHIKALIMIGDTAPRILRAIDAAGGTKAAVYDGASSMAGIVEQIKNTAQAGDVVLLSPACASFGMFKNYKDRGQQFKEAVRVFTRS